MRTCKGNNTLLAGHAPSSLASEENTLFDPPSGASSLTAYEEEEKVQSPSASSDLITDDVVRGVSPDPAWGPLPLASWEPSPNPNVRRHSVPAIPLPISQRVPIASARGFGPQQSVTFEPDVESAKPTASSFDDMEVMPTTSSPPFGASTATEELLVTSSYLNAMQPPLLRHDGLLNNQRGYLGASEMAAVADKVRRYSDSHDRPFHGQAHPVIGNGYTTAVHEPSPLSRPNPSRWSSLRDAEGFPVGSASSASADQSTIFKYLKDLPSPQQQQPQAHAQTQPDRVSFSASLMECDPPAPAASNQDSGATTIPGRGNLQQLEWQGAWPTSVSGTSDELTWQNL
ncbi:hypothetical protein DL93DRAFT_2168932 [Clavulina sp. PMI_390]|nr:hypothetical protein DL93DRAFT_2168932 [Clavulina sp. PMI_390]